MGIHFRYPKKWSIQIGHWFQGVNFYTCDKTITSLWRENDSEAGSVQTAMPVQK